MRSTERPAPGSRAFGSAYRVVRRGGQAASRRIVAASGGPARTRIVLVLGSVLALSSADAATVGAAAVQLRHSLGIGNTDIGLLVAVTSAVGAVFSVPFGVLADRVRRTWMLAIAILVWGVAMIWGATAHTFAQLMVDRIWLGAVTASTAPTVASLVGDWIPGAERGKIYGYILTGELAGAGVGFAVTGDIAALSWRAAFIILALPAFFLAWLVFKLPEPARGGQGLLAPEPGYEQAAAAADAPRPEPPPNGSPTSHGKPTSHEPTDAQRLAQERGIAPDPVLVRMASVRRMPFLTAVRYVLRVRTNVALIVSGACGYYFLAGIETFGVEFVRGQYGTGQVLANFLLLVVGGGAVLGVLTGGPLGDALLRRGRLNGRVLVAAVAAAATVVLFVPALVTRSAITALPYVVLAAFFLSAQNPPIDAARLDIMPPWLWGRAEGIRNFVRTGAQALAPVIFGAVSQYVFGGGTSGLRWTFVVMMVPLTASAVFLFAASRRYPSDVATAAAVAAPRMRGPVPPASPARGAPGGGVPPT
ncbi:MAG TPA: MFS transporter [Streptosporangiaceae bacterium]|nr:MFS transporter [Streptosporangiaceae bacterium]